MCYYVMYMTGIKTKHMSDIVRREISESQNNRSTHRSARCRRPQSPDLIQYTDVLLLDHTA